MRDSVNLAEQIERDERAMERIALAFEGIKELLTAFMLLEQAKFDRQYPARREVADAIVTAPKTRQQELEEAIADHDPIVSEWIGESERQWLKDHPEESSDDQRYVRETRIGARKVEGNS